MRFAWLGIVSLVLALPAGASAADAPVLSAERVLESLAAARYSSERMSISFGPQWSERYGWRAEGSIGLSLSEALAIGLVVTYGASDRELVVNAGLRLDPETVIIGTVAGHQQDVASGTSKAWVEQLETGVTVRHDDDGRLFGGLEISAYRTRSATAGEAVPGDAVGLVGSILMHPISGMTFSIGAKYESVTWGNGEASAGVRSDLSLTQTLDAIDVSLGASLGQYEVRYRAAVEFAPAGVGSGDRLGIEYMYIADRKGGPSDQRLSAY